MCSRGCVARSSCGVWYDGARSLILDVTTFVPITSISVDTCARMCPGVCSSGLTGLLNVPQSGSTHLSFQAFIMLLPRESRRGIPFLWLFKPPCPSRPPSFSLPVLVAHRGGEGPFGYVSRPA